MVERVSYIRKRRPLTLLFQTQGEDIKYFTESYAGGLTIYQVVNSK